MTSSVSLIKCPNCAKAVHPGWFKRGECAHAYCVDCRKQDGKSSIKATKSQRYERGLCALLRCSSPRTEHTPSCLEHFLSNEDRRYHLPPGTVANLFKDQNGLCAYTGAPLVPGLTFSLDHILPTSRFPDDISNPKNIQLTTRLVNSMKQSMTPQEFKEMCEIIVEHFSRI
ncbi:MAG: HNH endonuclease domain-containing protein [Betaproteobacteria bacterium]